MTTRRPLTILTVLVLALAVASSGAAITFSKAQKAKIAQLSDEWQHWLTQEVFPLISKEQTDAFLELETEAQRRTFVDRLWILWGRQTGYGSAFRGMYAERLQLVQLEFGNQEIGERGRALLIHGPPAIRFVVRCSEVFSPLELWAWPYIEGLGEGVVVAFYQRGGVGKWRMWYGGSRSELYSLGGVGVTIGAGPITSPLDRPEYRCPDGDQLVRLLAAAEYWARDPRVMQAMYSFQAPREGNKRESSSARFMEFSALLDDDAEPLEFEVSSRSEFNRGGLVNVGFEIDVPHQDLGTTEVGDVDVVQLDVIGEVSQDQGMVDRFRYVFSVPASQETLSLLMERLLRPGDYDLRLKVEDVHSKHAAVQDRPLVVAPASVGEDEYQAQLAAAAPPPEPVAVTADAGPADGPPPVLQLIGPAGEALRGIQRFEAMVGDAVDHVTFLLDGEAILTKNRPPFSIDLDLGPLPRLTTVSAVAFDADGAEIARQKISLNVGRERFYIQLQPVTPSQAQSGTFPAVVEVNTPTDATLASLEVFWNDSLVASLAEPPFVAEVHATPGSGLGLLRAVATLDDGSVAEDIQFVNAPQFGTTVEVTAVELPVTVLDKDDKPVENLVRDDFTVYEDDVVQELSHFSLNSDLPVRLGLVIDTSGSMKETLPTVQRVVMGFLRDLLRPADRAFVETFSDQPEVLAPFTADFPTLENAMLALYPDRATALYDSVIMGLFQFSGVRGRKAMVVLTDGEDTASKADFDTVLGYAQRNGVTIYTIGVDLPLSKLMARWQLSKLAEVTGGRSFFVSTKSDLDRIYDTIDQELRTQYLLAYTSSSTKPPDELRKIRVEVDRRRVDVRTITGYFPGGS